LADDFVFLEAPRWHEGRLWVTDVFDSIVYTVELDGRRSVVFSGLPPRPNSIGFLPNGTLVIVSSVNKQLLKLVDARLELHADLSAHAAGDLNDFVIDGSGRIYVGNFGYDLFGGAPVMPTQIHSVGLDGAVSIACGGLEFPNGTVITGDGRKLIVAETWAGRLTAFERDRTGNLSNPHTYALLGDRQPDGICIDRDDGIWVSSFSTGEVIRVLEGGQVTDRVAFRGSAVACQLGGDDGKTLFCTTYDGTIADQQQKLRRGAIHTVRVDVARASIVPH
jgi:sugar lactone lactonase YvrE